MQLSTLRQTVRRELNTFAWDQWAQLGVLATTSRRDRAATDPESLLLFTLEIARDDPRLFDEVLDWLLTNQSLISVQRLRNLCVDGDDRDLVEGALGWVARWRPRARLQRSSDDRGEQAPQVLFRSSTPRVQNPDPAFASVGLLKPDAEPSRKSRTPDPRAPICFAFRMRLLFGVGSRAEVLRYLLTNPSNDGSTQRIAESAGYAKRNVSETLSALADAGVLLVYDLGNEHRYALDPRGWNDLLRLSAETRPAHRDWVHLLRALRRLSRWLGAPWLDDLTPYMLASEAREHVAEIEADLNMAGIATSAGFAGEEYWTAFIEIAERALASLDVA